MQMKYFKWFMRFFLAGVVVVGIVLFINYKNKPLCDKCNVILVSLDTLSALHLPCYGYEKNTAINLCEYAYRNTFFINSYSQAPITLDSHFSIFTSLYPHTHKMTNIYGPSLNEKYLTLAQVFRNSGYKTIYNGPLTDAHLPLNRGIERGFNVTEGMGASSWNGSLARLMKNTQKNEPTFLFLHTYAVHNPYLTGHKEKHIFTNLPEYPNIPLTLDEYQKLSPEFLSFSANKIEQSNFYYNASATRNSDIEIAKKLLKEDITIEDKTILFNKLPEQVRYFCFSIWSLNNVDLKDPNQIDFMKALYDEQIYNLDKQLSQLFSLMDDPKLSKNTILIITADHGEEFMEHRELFHGQNLYQTSTRVPLIIHIPGVESQKIQEMVEGIDIYPTALSLTGLKPKSHIEGIDLTGMIRGDKDAPKNSYLLSEFNGEVSIQAQNWRYYYNIRKKNPTGLYNLLADPTEQKNLLSERTIIGNNFKNLVNTLSLTAQ